MKQGNETGSFYSDIKVILPIIVTILAILAAGATFIACIKRSRCEINNILTTFLNVIKKDIKHFFTTLKINIL